MSSPLDPYTDPATGVLRNRLGITDSDELDRAEAFWTASQLAQLHRRDGLRIEGSYDLPHLQAFHRFLFGEIYDWAGEIRTVAIAKADLFCLPQFIESYAADVFGKLARANHLRELDRSEFLNGLAEAIGDVNAVHPFREGNGRTQRVFFSQLARDAGHPLDWRRLDAQQNLIAGQASLRGDLAPLRALLDHHVALAATEITTETPDLPAQRSGYRAGH
ncbi:MAG: Fic/DOC family protein [Pseudonocardiaceae bacterium]